MHSCRITLDAMGEATSPPSIHCNYREDAYLALFPNLRVKPVLPFSRRDFFIQSPALSAHMSISGVQQKLSLKINKLDMFEITPTDGEYILKPSPEAFPHAAENEHCAMVTSRALGINTALCGLISFSDGELVYITRRFDRLFRGSDNTVHGFLGQMEKIHQEDLLQGFGMQSKEKYSASYETAGHLVREMTDGNMEAVFDFFRRVVHAFIIGNDDMHLKNISLQRFPKNCTRFYDRLTPHYDTLFTSAFASASRMELLALDLLESEREGIFSPEYEMYGFYTGHDFKRLGKRLGIDDVQTSGFLHHVMSSEEMLIALIRRSYMPMEMKKKACAMVSERIKALSVGL